MLIKGGVLLRKKYILIGAISILLILSVSIIIYYKLSNEHNHPIITEKISVQQAMSNCKFIEISDDEKDLINLVSQVSSIKDAMEKGKLKSFSTDIAKNIDKGKLSNSSVITDISTTYNAIYIGYKIEGYRIYLAKFKNGSIQKTVSKNKHEPFEAYLNTDNTTFEIAH